MFRGYEVVNGKHFVPGKKDYLNVSFKDALFVLCLLQ